MAQLLARSRFYPILHFFVYRLDNLHFFLTCHKCRRGDADGYIQILRRLLPATKHAIVFDTTGAEKLPEGRSAQLERML